MFYAKGWEEDDDVDDWDTDTDAINTENIRSGKSAAESLGGVLNAAEAAAAVKEQAISQPTYRVEGRAEENTGPVVRNTPTPAAAPAPVKNTPKPAATRGAVATPRGRGAAVPQRGRGGPQRGTPPPRGARGRGGAAAPVAKPTPQASAPAPKPVKAAPTPAPVREPSPEPIREPSPEPVRKAPKKPPPPPPQSSKPKPKEPEPEPEPEPYYEPEPYAEPEGDSMWGVYEGDDAQTYVPDEEGFEEGGYDEGGYDEGGYDEGGDYDEGAAGGLIAVCLYDFEGQEEGDLSLYAGDRITILDQSDPSGWWQGECNGVTGVFPSNFVELQ